MVRVKICGITSAEQAVWAAQAGADALGLVFYEPSPRYISFSHAQEILAGLPPFITSVGLFVNPDVAYVEQALKTLPLDMLQFHGDETPAFCEQFQVPYLKAIRVRSDTDLIKHCQRFSNSRGMLLDTYRADKPGGTGAIFDWSLIPKKLAKPIVLAGGLNPDNIRDAIAQVRPWAVDVSGGVEASPGQKDPQLISAFIEGVHGVTRRA